ncbi:uncharacterized protein LOC122640439 isoform X2 [Telopea speciosissima]|uniref:uncharacterized protein LOC122640439 isoform X2 n=1 Tax=Telopea speciosissima TaxID=54955 RepID=UPI001CC4EE99|nr:uncharacterized protein LOC122640439 isoform X2 [Telopea speciosissima]
MAVEEGKTREGGRVSSPAEHSTAAGERCSGSCSSSSTAVLSSEYSKCGTDRMVKIELDAARALADFAQLALLERENLNDDSGGKWGNKGRRSRKRSKNTSPARDSGKDLESSEIQSSKLRSLDLSKDGLMVGQSKRRRACKAVVMNMVKVEQETKSTDQPPCSTSYVSFGGGRSKQNLTEAEKEARRIRRILANRESARQTIRRRQAFCEELTKKAADLACDNENMKREKELITKEYQSLKDKNEQLKAQMVKIIKVEVKETPEETSSTHGDASASSSTELPLLIYNRPLFPPFLWPTIIHPLNPMQMSVVPENATVRKCPMPSNYELGSSNEQGNLPSLNGSRAPFYIIPCPWFLPLADHGNQLHSQPLDSYGLKEKQDENSINNHQDDGSSSKVMGDIGNYHQPSSKELKTDVGSSTEANTNTTNTNPGSAVALPTEVQLIGPHPQGVVLTPVPLRSVKPNFTVKCEDEFQTDSDSVFQVEAVSSAASYFASPLPEKLQGVGGYPNKKMVDVAVAAEARKRRKELTKLKNLHGRQFRMHC